MKHVRNWALGAGFLALGLAVLTGFSKAGDGDAKADARKVSALVKSGDLEGATSLAAKIAKGTDVEVIMELLKLSKKGGLGVGKGVTKNDGIEKKLQEIARDAPAASDMANLELMGYDIAAVALMTHAKAPASDKGKKSKKDWVSWSNDMKEHGIALAAAAKKKGPAEVKMAATKVNQSCNNCHSVFR